MMDSLGLLQKEQNSLEYRDLLGIKQKIGQQLNL